MADEIGALDAEVMRFRSWAATFPIAERSGEWECLYRDWDALSAAFFAAVAATTPSDWNGDAISSLLYAIARDNEFERLAGKVAEYPDKLLYLAERAANTGERDSKGQLAKQLGMLELGPPEAETLLLRFVRDEDEYVLRMALLALARIGSSHTEELARLAWDDGYEYQRIAALCALDMVESTLLAEYALLAEDDGRENLAMYAAIIRKQGTLRGASIQGIPIIS